MGVRGVCKGAVLERDQEIKFGPGELGVPTRHSSYLAAVVGIKCPIKHRGVMWNDGRLGLSRW